MISRTHLACFSFLSLVGCAAWHDRNSHADDTDSNAADSDADGTSADSDAAPVDSDDVLDEADSTLDEPEPPLAPACVSALPASSPALIAADIDERSIAVGACGHVAYLDGAKTLHLLDASYADELATAPEHTSPRFSPDGSLFVASAREEALFHDLRRGLTSTFPAERVGFLRRDERFRDGLGNTSPESVVYVCGDAGFGIVADAVVEPRFSSLGCDVVADAAHGSRLVLWRDDTLHALDFASGEDRTLPIPRATGDGERMPQHVFHLSTDGELLLHQVEWMVPCEDTSCPDGTSDERVFDLERGTSAAIQGFRGVLEAEPGAQRLAVALARSLLTLTNDSGLSVTEHALYEPLQVMPGHREVLARRLPDELAEGDGLVLIEFGKNGKVSELSATTPPSGSPRDPWFVVSSDGQAVGYQRIDHERCVHHPDNPASCHTQIYGFDVWTRGAGLRYTVASTQPLNPAWVGGDGTLLVQGGLLLGKVPEVAEPGSLKEEYGTFLFAPDGKVLTQLPGRVQQVSEAGATLLVVLSSGSEATLERIDLRTGRVTRVDRAASSVPEGISTYPSIHFWVDAAGERLVYLKSWDEGAERKPHNSLHAGRLF